VRDLRYVLGDDDKILCRLEKLAAVFLAVTVLIGHPSSPFGRPG
jgi:hypothetical protein